MSRQILQHPLDAHLCSSLDALDVAAGVAEAATIGFDSPVEVMAIELALNEWARGEEQRALGTMSQFASVDLTGAYRIVAAAKASPAATIRGERARA